KITRTMEMVATSKMKRAQDRVQAARPYALSLAEVIAGLYSPDLAERFPLLRQPAKVNRAAVILLTSNRGLAGGFNSNLIKEGRNLVRRLEGEGVETELHVVGKKGLGYFKYVGRAMVSTRIDITDRPTAENASELVNTLIDQFAAGTVDAVYVVYAKFISALSTPPTAEKILPVTPPEAKGPRPDYLLYPSAEAILAELLPLYVRNAVYRALVETAAGEQGARRTAMKNATDNAGDILNVLRRTFNRARQAQITQEIAEIVGGSAALEG
ncbi:MAG: ATP synthase F1 subunit gamma, partial [Gemmatimonadales bacterium]